MECIFRFAHKFEQSVASGMTFTEEFLDVCLFAQPSIRTFTRAFLYVTVLYFLGTFPLGF